jgi:release factor glutamine methyltransferase
MKEHSQKAILPALEQDLILAHILKKSREFVLIHPEVRLKKSQSAKYRELIARRLKNEPIAYILGRKEFYGLNFKVTPHTLIPRPETELLVDEFLKINPKNCTILDIGTGSGSIMISLVKNLDKQNDFFAVDYSEKALRVAKFNAKKHGVDKRIKFIKGNLLKPFIQNNKYEILNTNLIIAANLPYLSKKIYKNTALDVKKYEPRSALLSSNGGLGHYIKLINQIMKMKSKYSSLDITCYMEISPEQKSKLKKIIKNNFPESRPKFRKDLAGKWRVAFFQSSKLCPKNGHLSS